MPSVQLPQVQYDVMVLKGGLDQVTPTLSTPAGMVKDGINFEVSVTGGYSRITGYERTDGRPSPSDALYRLYQVGAFIFVPAVGDTVTGLTSGATGTIAAVGADYVALTRIVGAFTVGEDLDNGSGVFGPYAAALGSQGPQQDAILLAAASDIYRADITEVPGEGAILGVVFFEDELFAFRNAAGGLTTAIYKATAGGWTAVPLLYTVSFTAGSGDFADGDTLTQGANSATIKRVCLESGDFLAGTAAGRFIVTLPAPGNFAAGAATGSGGGLATLAGAQTQITLPPDGRYEFNIDNFGGRAATRRVYGCNGVGTAFEFDGEVLAPIITGSTPDIPIHLAIFKNHLFLAIDASVVHSAPGNPFGYQAIDGSSEIAVGDDITGLTVTRGEQQGGGMAIYGRRSTSILYGNDAEDWQRVSYGEGSGCIRYSAQYLNEPYVLDDRGVITLQTSLNYGNFDQATLTSNIQNYINAKRTRVVASLVNRSKSQYRLLFGDGSGLFLTILNGKYLGAMPVELGDIPSCAWDGEQNDGSEVSYFGSTNGFVYQLEKGNSFDGEPLIASFTLVYNHQRSPRIRKHYRRAAIEVSGQGYARIDFGYTLGYGSMNIPQAGDSPYASSFAAANWDSFTWDSFFWDGITLAPTEAELRGTAENISFRISSGTNYVAPFTINSIITHYTPRRGLR